MKRGWIPLLLALALLSGCGKRPALAEVLPDELPAIVKAVSLPEPRRLEPISAPAIVTEGRPPAEEYGLVPSIIGTESSHDSDRRRWLDGGRIELAAETENAALYVPTGQRDLETALIHWGTSLAEFDWVIFCGPNIIPPWLVCLDFDNNGEDELIVICHIGTGTGVSIDELHILEKAPDGSLTNYTFPESLWQEQFPALFDTAQIHGRTFAMLGHELVEFEQEGLDLKTASSGLIAQFNQEGWSGLQFQGAFCLNLPGRHSPCYQARTSAQVTYQNGMFTLQDFHLYSYDQ